MDEKTKKGIVMNLLEEQLNKKGLLSVSEKSMEAKDSSWFIVLFHSIGGIISGLLILILLAIPLHDVADSSFTMIVFGILLLGFSYFLMQKDKSDFLEYFALVFSFTAEGLIIFGFGDLELFSINMALFLLLIFQTILFFLFNSMLHRFISSLIIIVLGFYFFALFSVDFIYQGILLVLMTWLWLNEYNYLKYINHLRMFAYALVIFLLISDKSTALMWIGELKYDILAQEDLLSDMNHKLSYLFYFITNLSVMSMIYLKQSLEFKNKVFISLFFGTFMVYFFQPIGLELTTSIIVLLLAFIGQNRVLWTLGILSSIYNIFSYYNLLYIPFMTKSLGLLEFGLIVLILAALLQWYLKKYKGESHA